MLKYAKMICKYSEVYAKLWEIQITLKHFEKEITFLHALRIFCVSLKDCYCLYNTYLMKFCLRYVSGIYYVLRTVLYIYIYIVYIIYWFAEFNE